MREQGIGVFPVNFQRPEPSIIPISFLEDLGAELGRISGKVSELELALLLDSRPMDAYDNFVRPARLKLPGGISPVWIVVRFRAEGEHLFAVEDCYCDFLAIAFRRDIVVSRVPARIVNYLEFFIPPRRVAAGQGTQRCRQGWGALAGDECRCSSSGNWGVDRSEGGSGHRRT